LASRSLKEILRCAQDDSTGASLEGVFLIVVVFLVILILVIILLLVVILVFVVVVVPICIPSPITPPCPSSRSAARSAPKRSA